VISNFNDFCPLLVFDSWKDGYALFVFNCGVRPFYEACCFDELIKGSISCFLNTAHPSRRGPPPPAAARCVERIMMMPQAAAMLLEYAMTNNDGNDHPTR
jgi:hypothetical protein